MELRVLGEGLEVPEGASSPMRKPLPAWSVRSCSSRSLNGGAVWPLHDAGNDRSVGRGSNPQFAAAAT